MPGVAKPLPIILLIDDDVAVRRSLSLMLRVAGFIVECFANGAEFLQRNQTLDGCLVLCDLVMPRVNGLQLVAELRRHGWDGPAVLITGVFEPDLAARAARRHCRGARKTLDLVETVKLLRSFRS